MAGYIGTKASVTVTSPETDSRYVNTTGDTMTGDLTVPSFTATGASTGTDLTLSGGVYLGGTGSANKLDDYEEGTLNWVLKKTDENAGFVNMQRVRYTKIGGVVCIQGRLRYDDGGASGSGSFEIVGTMPFLPIAGGGLFINHIRSNDALGGIISVSFAHQNTTVYVHQSGNTYDSNSNNVGANTQTNLVLEFNGVYHTDA